MTTRSSDRLRRAAAHPLAVPVLMAVLICLAGAHVASVFKIPSWGNDEAPHVGYVAALAHGNLPTIDSPIIDDWARFPPDPGLLLGWDAEHRDIWTANHPPIYHLLLVPIWRPSRGRPVAHGHRHAAGQHAATVSAAGFCSSD